MIRALDKTGLAYRTVDVTADPDARDYVLSLGYLQVPVVVTAAGEHFGGYRRGIGGQTADPCPRSESTHSGTPRPATRSRSRICARSI